ncbi:hypothetical protein [Amycolatopsis sp. NPDC059021]|uniref:WXG100-like domain-containing protein n=1 Tax=Amycolatopsis sp. NPDC059021 TaxID=3346704 RepID=UPI00366F396A
MADPSDIQEPSDELFIRVKKIWGVDAVWPRDSEGDAQKLGEAWESLATALTKLATDGQAQLKDLHEAWQDLAGVAAYDSLRSLFAGSDGKSGIQALAGQCTQLAELCKGYAKQISDMKGEIIADLAINVALFALSFALAGPAGEAFFAARFGAMIAARMAQFAEAVEAMGAGLRFGLQAGMNAGFGALAGGLGNLAGQELSNLRGYGPINWDNVGHAAGAGAVAGAIAHGVFTGAGKPISKGVTWLAGKTPGISGTVAGQIGNIAGVAATGAGAGAATAAVFGQDAIDGAIGGAAIGGSAALAIHGGRNTYEHVTGNRANSLQDLIKPSGGGDGDPPGPGASRSTGGDPPPSGTSERHSAGTAENAQAGAESQHSTRETAQHGDGPVTRAGAQGADHPGTTQETTVAENRQTATPPGHETTANAGPPTGETVSNAVPRTTAQVPAATMVENVHNGSSTVSHGTNSSTVPAKSASVEPSVRQAASGDTPAQQASAAETSKTQQAASRTTESPEQASPKPKQGEQPGKGGEQPAKSTETATPPEKSAPAAAKQTAEGQAETRGRNGGSQQAALQPGENPKATPGPAVAERAEARPGERESGSDDKRGSAPEPPKPSEHTGAGRDPASAEPRGRQGERGLVVEKITTPEPLTLADGTSHTLPAGSEIVRDRATRETVAYRQTTGEDGKPLAKPATFFPTHDGGWARTEKPLDPAMHEAWLANANYSHETARLLDDLGKRYSEDLPKRERLNNLRWHELKSLLRGSADDVAAAIFEAIRRREGIFLRWTQLSAADALGNGKIVNMAAGEGKSYVYLVHAVREAMRNGVDAVNVIQTRGHLADRELERYRKVLGKLDIDVHRITPDEPMPVPEPGRPTIYIGTQQDLEFTVLKQKQVPGQVADGSNKIHAVVDEIDEAFVYSDTKYVLSEGADQLAPPEIAQEVHWAQEFLDTNLTREHFSPAGGREGQLLALNKAGGIKVVELLGEAPPVKLAQRLNMAANAKWMFEKDVHYIVDDGVHPKGPGASGPDGPSVKIIDPVTHEVLYDPKTATESRWNGGLAQAVEAREGLPVRDDPIGHNEITAGETYGKGKLIESVTGASGTANGHGEHFSSQGLPGEVADTPVYYNSRLQQLDDVFTPNSAEKLKTMAQEIKDFQTNEERPQLVLMHRNDLVGKLSDLLTKDGVEHVAVDAKQFTKWGTHRPEEFKKILDEAGGKGKVLVVNMQGARGVDIKVAPEMQAQGGLRVRVSARSPFADIDIQAENRTARNGEPGDVVYYPSLDDEVFRLAPDAQVEHAIVRYEKAHAEHENAAAEHSANPTPENRQALTNAEQELSHAGKGLTGSLPQLRTHALAGRVALQMLPTHQPNAPPGPAQPTGDLPAAPDAKPPPSPRHTVLTSQPGEQPDSPIARLTPEIWPQVPAAAQLGENPVAPTNFSTVHAVIAGETGPAVPQTTGEHQGPAEQATESPKRPEQAETPEPGPVPASEAQPATPQPSTPQPATAQPVASPAPAAPQPAAPPPPTGTPPGRGSEGPTWPRPRSLAKASRPLTGTIEIHGPLSTVRGARQKRTAEEVSRSRLLPAATAADVGVVENVPFPLPSADAVVLEGAGVPFVFQTIHVPNLGHSTAKPITFQVYLEATSSLPLPRVVLRLPDWLTPDQAVLPMAHAMAAGAAMVAERARGGLASLHEQHLGHDLFPGQAPVLTPTDLGHIAQIVALGKEIDQARWRDRRRLRAQLGRLLSDLGLAEDDPYGNVRLRALAGYGTRIRMNAPPEARDAATAADSALIIANRYRPAKAVKGYRSVHRPVEDPAVEIGYRVPVDAPARPFGRAAAVGAAVREHLGKAGSRAGVRLVPSGPDLRYDAFVGERKIFTVVFHVLPGRTLETTGVSVHPGRQLLSGYLPARTRLRDVEEVVSAAIAYGARYFTTATADPHAHTLHQDTDLDALPSGPADRAFEARIEVLGDRVVTTPAWRPWRRRQLVSQLRELLERAGLEKQLPGYSYRAGSLGPHARAVVDEFARTRSHADYLPTWFHVGTALFNEYPAMLAMGVTFTIAGAAQHHAGNGIGYLVYGLVATLTGAAMARKYDIASDKQAAKKKKWDEIRAAVDHGRALADSVNSWRHDHLGRAPKHNAEVPSAAQLQGEAPDIAPSLTRRYLRFGTPRVAGLAAGLAAGWPLGIAASSVLGLLFAALATTVLQPLAEGISRRSRKGAELAQQDDLRRTLNSYDIEEINDLYRQIEQAFAVIDGHLADTPLPADVLARLTPAPAERPGVAYDVREPVLGTLSASSGFIPYVPDPNKLARPSPSLKPIGPILEHLNAHATVVAFDLVRLAVAGSVAAWAENRLAVREVNNKLTRLAMRMRAERETQLPMKTQDRDQLLRDIIVQALRIVADSEKANPAENAWLPPVTSLPPELDRLFGTIRSHAPRLPDPVSRKASASRWAYAGFIATKSAAAGAVTVIPSALLGMPGSYLLGASAAAVAGLLAVAGRPFHRIREILVDDRAGSPVEKQGDQAAVENRHVLQQVLESGLRGYAEKYGEALPGALVERVSHFVTSHEQPTLPAVTPLAEFEPISFTDESLRSGEWAREVRARLASLAQAIENELRLWGFRPTLERRQALLRDELPRLAARVESQLGKYEGTGDSLLADRLAAALRDYLRTGEGDFTMQVQHVLWEHEAVDVALVRDLKTLARQYESTGRGDLGRQLVDLLWRHGYDRDRQLVDRVAELTNIRSGDDRLAAHLKMLLHWYETGGDGHLARQVHTLLRRLPPGTALPGQIARLLHPFEEERARAARLAVEAVRELNELVAEYQKASDPVRFTRVDDPAPELPEPVYRTPGQLLMDKFAEELKPPRTVLGSRYLADRLPEDWAKRLRERATDLLADARRSAALAVWAGEKTGKYTLVAATADTAPPAVLESLLRDEVPQLPKINPKHSDWLPGREPYRTNCVPATSAFLHALAGWDTGAVAAKPERATLAALWQEVGGTWQAHGTRYDNVIAAMTGRKGMAAALAVVSRGRHGEKVRHVSAVVVSEKTGVPIFVDPLTGYATKLPDHPKAIYLLPVDLAALRSMKDVELPPDGLAKLPDAERTAAYHGQRGRELYELVRQSPLFKSKGLPPLPAARPDTTRYFERHPLFQLWGRSPLAKANRMHALPAIDAGTASRAEEARFLRENHPDYAQPNPHFYGTAWRDDGWVDQGYLAHWFGGFWFHHLDSYDSVIVAMADRPIGARALMLVVTSDERGVEEHRLGYVAHGPYGVAFFDRQLGRLLHLPEYPDRLALLPYTDPFLPWPDAPPEYQPAPGKLFVPDAPPARHDGEPRADVRPAEPSLPSFVDDVRITPAGPRNRPRPPMRQAPHPSRPDPSGPPTAGPPPSGPPPSDPPTAGPPPEDPPPDHSSNAAKPARYGPYHRAESSSQSPEVAKMMVESSELWGKAARFGNSAVVQAWNGPLPDGDRGVEFYTDVKPRFYGTKVSLREWREGQNVILDGDYVKVAIVVTKNTQTTPEADAGGTAEIP